MAEKTVCISHQQTRPIKIIKWKVREGNSIAIGRIVLLYNFNEENVSEQRKLKSTQAGTIKRILAQEGAIIKSGETLLEIKPCSHPTIMNDMCAECGADLRKDDLKTIASVPMVHAIPDLKVSEELAQKLGKADNDRLIKDRKLVLLVDLDQTLIHTTNDNIPPNIMDVYHFQLYGPNSPWYHTRLRPGTHRFLENICGFFELHICTFGARNYAHMIAMFLDADQNFFSNRILSRDECFDPTSKKANLKALFPCGDDMVCIIDDREDVWSRAANLIHVKPYHFFQHTGDINAPPGLDKQDSDEGGGIDLTNIVKKADKKIGDDSKMCKQSLVKENVGTNDDTKQVESSEKCKEEEVKNNKEDEVKISKEDEVKISKEDEVKSSEGKEVKSSEEVNNKDIEHLDKKELVADVKSEQDTPEVNNQSDVNEEKVPAVQDKIEKNGMRDEKLVLKKTNDSKDETLKKSDALIEIDDPDDYLLYLECILKRIHNAYYEQYDKMDSGEVPDLKKVIPCVKSDVLKGTKLAFSGLVPTHIKLEHSKAYQVARTLGATVTQNLENDTTHLVAVRPGTAKVNSGKRKKNLKIVTPDWLWSCAERWEHVNEKVFPLNSNGSKNRHPPPHCSSPEHATNYPVHDSPALRKRTPSGRFMDTINPLMSFSSADIADMDKEVEDILDDESESSEDEKPAIEKIVDVLPPQAEDSSSSSSSVESLTAEFPRGYKRSREDGNSIFNDDFNTTTEDDEMPSAKFRRGEMLDVDLDIEPDSHDSEGSIEPPDEVDDGEWNMMGAALEREFLSNE